MSIEAMAWVLYKSKTKGAMRLLMVAIANYAQPDGTGAYPSIKTLAERCNIKERAIQSMLNHAVDFGELRIRRGQGPKGVNVYDILVQQSTCGGATDCTSETDCAGATDGTGANLCAPGVQFDAKTGATGCTQSLIDPLINPLILAGEKLETGKLETEKTFSSESFEKVFPGEAGKRFAQEAQKALAKAQRATLQAKAPSKQKRTPAPPADPQQLTAQQAMIGALARATHMDAGMSAPRLARQAVVLVKAGYTPEQVDAHFEEKGPWYQEWPGLDKGKRTPPRPEQVVERLPRYIKSAQKQASNGYPQTEAAWLAKAEGIAESAKNQKWFKDLVAKIGHDKAVRAIAADQKKRAGK